MLRRTLATAAIARVGSVELWATEPADSPFVQLCRRLLGIHVHLQISGDLGARMSHALRVGLTRAEKVLLIGADIPSMTHEDLREARDADLFARDADHVVIAHPQREPARRFARRVLAPLARVETPARDDNARDAVEVARCVARSLVFDQLGGAERGELGHRWRQRRDGARDVRRQRGRYRGRHVRRKSGRCRARHAGRQRRRRRTHGSGGFIGIAPARFPRRKSRFRRRRERAAVRLRECREARIRSLARAPHGVLARGARERQRAAACKRTEERRADRRGVPAPDRLHVEQHRVLRERAHRVDDAAAVEARVAAAHFLARRVDAMRGRDDRRACRRAHAAFQHARGLEQLGADEHVHLAGNRSKPEHRRRSAPGRPRDLDVIRRRAGALRHARRRCRLRERAFGARRVHDPVRQDAAALSAQRGDQDRHRPAERHRRRRRPGAHAMSSARVANARTPAKNRSHAVGAVMTSVR